ncbi:hypothetical protein G6F37_002364 [Rhizopus arrhizus]|nr:hypothetical protein G6F38_010711 [Rhizopus arrhizus]KAG1162201.1 hypothetical protein G6F37_002364 [Rhizopus arrhizus]
MSTFIFAPSWVDYPNRTKIPKNIDEFPTLASSKDNNNKKKLNDNVNNNVWSNSHIIQKIQRPEDEEYVGDDVSSEEKKIELERLKALVPKRKPIIPSRSRSMMTPKPMKARLNTPLARTITATSNNTSNSNNNIKTFKVPTPKLFHQHISEEEKQRFIMFIKSWTSSGATKQENDTKRIHDHNVIGYNNHNQQQSFTCYSYFDTFGSLNDKINNNNVSYFYYNHFPTSSTSSFS